MLHNIPTCKGAFSAIKGDQYTTLDGESHGPMIIGFNFAASKSNDVYKAKAGYDVVRPTSISTTMWKRIA